MTPLFPGRRRHAPSTEAGAQQPGYDLSTSAVRGIFWTGGAQVVRQIVQVAAQVVLARLLLPEDFGLLGMALVFVGIGRLLADFGIGSAIVQTENVDDTVLSSSFWANLGVAVGLALLLVVAAPTIASFYDAPRVAGLVILLSANLIIAGCTTIPRALLFRSMSFGDLARAEVFGSCAGSAVAVAMAAVGFGVWSLGAQPVLGNLVVLVVTWGAASWRPRLLLSLKRIRNLLHFSAGVLGSDLLNYANRNTDDMLIGRVLGEGPLGLYSIAYQVMVYPLNQVSAVIVKVLFPTLSKLQADVERFRNAYLKAVSSIAMVTGPMMLGLLVVADDFVSVVLGDKWAPMTGVLRIFCVIGLVQSIGSPAGTIYLSRGRTQTLFWMTCLFTPVIVASFLIGLPWGIQGVALAYAIATCSIFYVTLGVAFRIGQIPFGRFHRAVLPPLLAAAAMSAVVLAFRWLTVDTLTRAWRFPTSVAVGVVTYPALLFLVNGPQCKELLERVRAAFAAPVREEADDLTGCGG